MGISSAVGEECFCSCLLSVLATGAWGLSSVVEGAIAVLSTSVSELGCEEVGTETEEEVGEGAGDSDESSMVVICGLNVDLLGDGRKGIYSLLFHGCFAFYLSSIHPITVHLT